MIPDGDKSGQMWENVDFWGFGGFSAFVPWVILGICRAFGSRDVWRGFVGGSNGTNIWDNTHDFGGCLKLYVCPTMCPSMRETL